MRLGVLLSVVVMMVQLQCEMKRKTLDGGMRCSGVEESSTVHDSSVYVGHVSLLSIRCSQSMHTRLSLLSMYTFVVVVDQVVHS